MCCMRFSLSLHDIRSVLYVLDIYFFPQLAARICVYFIEFEKRGAIILSRALFAVRIDALRR